MLLPSRVAGRMLGLNGADLAHGPEVARPCPKWSKKKTFFFNLLSLSNFPGYEICLILSLTYLKIIKV